MYENITTQELMGIDQKTVGVNDENKIKLMYTCNPRPKFDSDIRNFILIIIMLSIIILVSYKIIINKKKVKLVDFARNHDIAKLLIGLLLLNHVKQLSSSLVNNIILPFIEPILPYIQCNISFNYKDGVIELGQFITDIIVFSINLIILYILYLAMISY